MQFNNRDMDELRKRYPAGTRLELISMDGENDMLPGLRGTVEFVDDAGQIHLAWDNGRGLALIPGADSFRSLTPKEITTEREMMKSASIGDIHTSPDFQCDITGGYPTVLVWNQDRGTAILQPSPAFDDDSEESNQCIRDCAGWGVHPCSSWEDYNDLLKSIGEEAYANGAVPLDDEDEDEKFGGMSF